MTDYGDTIKTQIKSVIVSQEHVESLQMTILSEKPSL